MEVEVRIWVLLLPDFTGRTLVWPLPAVVNVAVLLLLRYDPLLLITVRVPIDDSTN